MSSSLLYTGSTGPRELTPRFEKRAGVWVTVRRWRGLKGELLGIADGLTDPDATLAQEDDVWWLLESTQSGRVDDPDGPPPSLDSQVVTLWSLHASRFTKSIWLLPKVAREFDKAVAAGTGNPGTDDEVTGVERAARFRGDLIALARGDEVKHSIKVVGTTTRTLSDGSTISEPKVETELVKLKYATLLTGMAAVGMDTTIVDGLFKELGRGVEAYPVDAFVLRKRSVAPNGANISPAFENTNRPISTATLLAQEPLIPGTLRSRLPEGYWTKAAPISDQTDATRFDIVQEWTHSDDYSQFIYGTAL